MAGFCNGVTNQQLPSTDTSTEHENTDSTSLLFSCRCRSVRSIATLLSCLQHVSKLPSSHSSHETLTSKHPSRLSQCMRLPNTSYETNFTQASGIFRKISSKAQFATVYVNPSFLTFHVHGFAKQSQASVELQAELFTEFHVASFQVPLLGSTDSSRRPCIDKSKDEKQEDSPQSQKYETIQGGEFSINLTTVLECFHVLGHSNMDHTSLCMSYDQSSAILKIELLLNDSSASMGSLLSTCAIPGMVVPDEDEDFEDSIEGFGGSLSVAFRASRVNARAILSSCYLRDAVNELVDLPGATCCSVGISPNGIEMGAVGYHGECLVSLPTSAHNAYSYSHLFDSNEESSFRNKPNAYISLECDPPRLHSWSYPLHTFLQGMRGLEVANETCISINQMGMIAIQHQVLTDVGIKGSGNDGNSQPTFVDFIMGAIDEGSENEDEKDDSEGGCFEGSARSKDISGNTSSLSNEDFSVKARHNEVIELRDKSFEKESHDLELCEHDFCHEDIDKKKVNLTTNYGEKNRNYSDLNDISELKESSSSHTSIKGINVDTDRNLNTFIRNPLKDKKRSSKEKVSQSMQNQKGNNTSVSYESQNTYENDNVFFDPKKRKETESDDEGYSDKGNESMPSSPELLYGEMSLLPKGSEISFGRRIVKRKRKI